MKLQQDHHQRGGDVEGEARAASFHGCMCARVSRRQVSRACSATAGVYIELALAEGARRDARGLCCLQSTDSAGHCPCVLTVLPSPLPSAY
jgi:hypothetical protein